jgi:hypothetical protein
LDRDVARAVNRVFRSVNGERPWRIACGLLLCLAFGAPAADAQPDLTGVWAPATAAGPPGAAAAPLPFTEGGKRKVAEYQALVTPTGDTPGGYCLGAGMPGSMLGVAGYPMEIIQRPDQITIIYELHSEVRRVYLGSRVIPEPDRVPDRNGQSSTTKSVYKRR